MTHFIKPSDREAKGFNIMVFGPPGSGKTHLIGTILKTLKEGERIAYLEYNGGFETIQSMYGKEEIDKKVRIASPTNIKGIDSSLVEIENRVNTGQIKVVVIDTFTEMQGAVMTDICSKLVHGDNVKIIKAAKPGFDQWAINREIMYKIADFLVYKLNANVVVTALADYKNSPVSPAIDTRIAERITGMFSIILYMPIPEKIQSQGGLTIPEYLCYSQPVDPAIDFIARDRYGVLEPIITPDFEYIFGKLNSQQY